MEVRRSGREKKGVRRSKDELDIDEAMNKLEDELGAATDEDEKGKKGTPKKKPRPKKKKREDSEDDEFEPVTAEGLASAQKLLHESGGSGTPGTVSKTRSKKPKELTRPPNANTRYIRCRKEEGATQKSAQEEWNNMTAEQKKPWQEAAQADRETFYAQHPEAPRPPPRAARLGPELSSAAQRAGPGAAGPPQAMQPQPPVQQTATAATQPRAISTQPQQALVPVSLPQGPPAGPGSRPQFAFQGPAGPAATPAIAAAPQGFATSPALPAQPAPYVPPQPGVMHAMPGPVSAVLGGLTRPGAAPGGPQPVAAASVRQTQAGPHGQRAGLPAAGAPVSLPSAMPTVAASAAPLFGGGAPAPAPAPAPGPGGAGAAGVRKVAAGLGVEARAPGREGEPYTQPGAPLFRAVPAVIELPARPPAPAPAPL
eukprot:tig00020685_g12926.t1